MKPAAPLTATLLARKGQAAPVMGPRSVSHALPQEIQETAPDQQSAKSPAEAGENKESVAPAAGQPVSNHAAMLSKLEDALIEKALSRGMALAAEGHDLSAASGAAKKAGKTPKQKAHVGEGERIAMTVRLSHEEHLKLKVFAAHTKLSSQEIFTAALESYMTKSVPKPLKASCLCFGKAD